MANKVEFIAEVTDGMDCSAAKASLEQLASDISVVNMLTGIGCIVAETSQGTYESLFDAKLEYRSYRWVELKSSKVPSCLAGIIDVIMLNATYRVPAPKYGWPVR